MKRIKIKPYPNFKLTDTVMSEIKNNSTEGQNYIHMEEDLLLVAEFNDDNRRMLKSSTVENINHNKFITVTPNLISIYIDTALEYYHKSEEIRNKSFISCGEKANKKIKEYYLLDIDCDKTHHCYNEFIKYKIISIIFSITTIEAYMNYIIPKDYLYKPKNKNIDNKNIQRHTSFNDKLEIIIPDIISNLNYWVDNEEVNKDKIDYIYQLRNAITHLKTLDNQSLSNINKLNDNFYIDFENYSNVFKDLINVNLKEHIENIIFFINDIHMKMKNENFIEYSTNEYISVVNTDKIDYDFIKNYLNSSNLEMYKYFNVSKTAIKKWEHNEIPKDKKDFFINKEGENINSYLKLLSNKYYI